VELHIRKLPFESEPNGRQEAHRLARVRVAFQPWASSLRHNVVPLTAKQRALIQIVCPAQ
jgi:hypothetical protein